MITKLIVYLKKSEKSMTSQIILLPSAKNRNFSNFHCTSITATNITLDVVLHLEHGGITSFYI